MLAAPAPPLARCCRPSRLQPTRRWDSSGFRSSSVRRTVNSSVRSVRCRVMSVPVEEKKPVITDYPPVLGDDAQSSLVSDALYWAAMHGLLVRADNAANLVHAPISLLPSLMPRRLFDLAVSLATSFNGLVDAVAQDAHFLQTSLNSARATDSFTARLLDIHAATEAERREQPIRMGMHRSDYMLDTRTGGILQVELNTISSSFAALGTRVAEMHRYLAGRSQDTQIDPAGLLPNNALRNMTEALAVAWQEYGNDRAVVLFVVQPAERNVFDQQWLAAVLWEEYGIRTMRKTLKQLQAAAALQGGKLVIDDTTAAVVYFRAGYSPDDYTSELEWQARELMERSDAVKCPSIEYHLAGAKKIQQVLAEPGVLERYLPDVGMASSVRKTFAGLWSLEGSGALEIIDAAINDPQSYVMKPQREGGGNNLYADDMKAKLKELRSASDSERAAYILMQRIMPPVQRAYLLRKGECIECETLSELGIFSTFVRNGDKVILNKNAGHLLRTKTATSNEGGVAAGFAVLDSPYLVLIDHHSLPSSLATGSGDSMCDSSLKPPLASVVECKRDQQLAGAKTSPTNAAATHNDHCMQAVGRLASRLQGGVSVRATTARTRHQTLRPLRQQNTATSAAAAGAASTTAAVGLRRPGAGRPWPPLPLAAAWGSSRCSVRVSTVAMARTPTAKRKQRPDNEDLTLDNVSSATAEQLKAFFRSKGLPVSGNKTELIARAEQALKSSSEGAGVPGREHDDDDEGEAKVEAEPAAAAAASEDEGDGREDHNEEVEEKPVKRKRPLAKSDEKAKQQRRNSSSSKKKSEVSEDDTDNDSGGNDNVEDKKPKRKPARTASPAKRGKNSKSNGAADTVPYTVDMRPPRYKGSCLRILSWNVNGLRALLKKDAEAVRAVVEAEDADVVCLQETKLSQKDVSGELKGLLAGYESHWCCADKPGYSGTVLFTRVKPLRVTFGISMPMHDMEGRVITAEYDAFYITNVYIPNAGEGLKRVDYRVEDWDPAISKYITDLEKNKPVVMAGDLNIAREDIDIHNPKGNHKTPGFSPRERESARQFLKNGERVDTLRAMHPNAVAFTYWSYRFNSRAKNKGWRLDYFIVSKSLADRVHDSFVLPDVMGSDHCPIGVVIKL
eukprot:jgi/Chlat1/7479/Chrsp6S07483